MAVVFFPQYGSWGVVRTFEWGQTVDYYTDDPPERENPKTGQQKAEEADAGIHEGCC